MPCRDETPFHSADSSASHGARCGYSIELLHMLSAACLDIFHHPPSSSIVLYLPTASSSFRHRHLSSCTDLRRLRAVSIIVHVSSYMLYHPASILQLLFSMRPPSPVNRHPSSSIQRPPSSAHHGAPSTERPQPNTGHPASMRHVPCPMPYSPCVVRHAPCAMPHASCVTRHATCDMHAA